MLEKQLAEARVNLQAAEAINPAAKWPVPSTAWCWSGPIATSGNTRRAATLLKIGRWEDLEIEADVLSQELAPVKAGSAVDVSGPAIGTRPVVAHVTRIYPAGFTKISSLGVEQQRVKVVMRFGPADLARLRAEQGLGVDYRVRVRIFTAERSGTLSIPRSSLFRGAEVVGGCLRSSAVEPNCAASRLAWKTMNWRRLPPVSPRMRKSCWRPKRI